ncbi:MAG TPA: DUF938 domain-containing protein [Ramlibacter sp.]|nr:DUF938 domain-containing protein [Ramlibacter sp.]
MAHNVQAPVQLDADAHDWKLAEHGLPSAFTAMFCANVIHIAPWHVAEGIFAGAGRHLSPDGRLFLYGPFRRDGVCVFHVIADTHFTGSRTAFHDEADTVSR